MPATASSRLRPSLLGVVAVAAACALGIALVGCGPSGDASSPKTGGGLFDSSKVHEITVSFAEEDYDAMVATYESSGEKDWIAATVEIDGRAYKNVGLRLKGNSSIMGLRKGGVARGPSGSSSVDAPERLPWLIRLDKNIDGQNHHGIFDLVVRSNATKTSLNEAVSLELLQMAGLASQRAIAVRFTVNKSAAALRLVTENPDDVWMTDNLDAGGALYKAESTGDYSYRGTDPDSYDDVFDQEAGKYITDLTPLIGFLDFINNSDDATFNAQLGDRLDIESFATYLAMEDLLDNFDDIDGPGNNSYLYYDPAAGIFTVVPWDHNLALGGFDGGVNGPGTAQPGGFNGGGGLAPAQPGGDVGERGMAPPGSPNKSNILAKRFHANPEFEASYKEQIIELTGRLYESGAAADVLAKWVSVLKTQATDLVDSSTVEQEAANIATFFKSQ